MGFLGVNFVKDQTPEMCLLAVKQNGLLLPFVKVQTPEICLTAVKQNGYALEYVNEQSLAVGIAALKQNPESRYYLTDKFRTPEVYKAAGYDYKPEDLAPKYRDTERGETLLSR